MKKLKAICFGEVLWDVFPGEARIGGAPLNVASRLSSFGLQTEMISQIGKDERGDIILDYLQAQGVGTENISVSNSYPTGIVKVSLSSNGSASYEISHPSAWDKMQISEEAKKAVEESSVFIFGSLACRDEVSRKALFSLLPLARYKVLDFNLRPPHYTIRIILELIQQADFIKFNDDELFEIAAVLGSPYNSIEQNILFVSSNTAAKTICVTKGRHGAVVFHDDNWYYNSGYKIMVKDTVGAGDSFLATLLAKMLKGFATQKALDYACAVGALVAAEEGANPKITEEQVEKFMFPKRKHSTTSALDPRGAESNDR